MTRTIAIVEQFPLSRAGLAHFLNQHFVDHLILEHENVNELNRSHNQLRPGLIVLGLNGDWFERGLAQLDSLRSNYPTAKVIVYDDSPDSTKALKYLKRGACGYVSKSEKAASLKDGIDKILDGKRYIDRDILDTIFEDQIFRRKTAVSHRPALTRNESIVVNHLIDGLKVTQIAAMLQKKVSNISASKRRIFEKLDVTNVSELEAKVGTNTSNDSVR